MRTIALNLQTSVTYTANGTQKQFDFPFDYLRKAFVYVAVDGVVQEYTKAYTVDNRSIRFVTAPAKDSLVNIYRSTPTDRLVAWADASVLKASDMTIQQVQQLHIVEENTDWIKVQMDALKTEVYENVDDKMDETRQEVFNRLDTVIKEVDELVNQLNSASKEELMEIRENVEYWANIAQASALINCHWPIGEDRVRDPNKPTYGLDGASLILNVPDVLKLEVVGESNPDIPAEFD